MPPHFVSTDLGPWPGLLQIENPPSKSNNYKMKNQGGRHQHKLATKCHAQGLYFVFIIQHVIYSFVAGHFVATKLVSQLSAGKSFCSYVRVARADVVRIYSDAVHFLPLPICRFDCGCILYQSGLLLDFLPPSETTKCFPGSKKHIATKMFWGFYVVTCYPKKAATKWLRSLTI